MLRSLRVSVQFELVAAMCGWSSHSEVGKPGNDIARL